MDDELRSGYEAGAAVPPAGQPTPPLGNPVAPPAAPPPATPQLGKPMYGEPAAGAPGQAGEVRPPVPPAGPAPLYGSLPAPGAQPAQAQSGQPPAQPLQPPGALQPWWPAAPGLEAGPGAAGWPPGGQPGWAPYGGPPPWSSPVGPSPYAAPLAGQPPAVAAGGSGRSGGPPPFYAQHQGYSAPQGPYGWTYSAGAAESTTMRRRRSRTGVATLLAGVALLAGGLGAALGVVFSGNSSPGAATAGGSAPPPGRGQGNNLSPFGSSGRSGGSPATSGNNNAVRNIANEVDPAVVDINVEDAIAGPAAGTGMIISSSGYVLTNNHVIDQATTVQVTVAGHASAYPAKVVGYDAAQDVALVKIEGVSGLPTVRFGDSSSVSVGDSVVAIGNALGQGGPPTVVSGSVTALGRTITAGDEVTGVPETLHGVIQTDAQIQPGDSGGPLVDAKGRVIGMDTANASSEAGTVLGFAIPIDRARSIAEQIIAGKAGGGVAIGLSAFLGIDVSNGSNGGGGGLLPFGSSGVSGQNGAGQVSGVTVSNVISNSPAAQAGMQGGDVITSIDGKPTPTFAALHKQIQGHQPGQKITIGFVDETGASHTVTVVLSGIPY